MKYFTIAELCNSATATKQGIDNSPNTEATQNLTTLIEKVLDPAREAMGRAITISSGYRSPRLNQAIGGVTASQHSKGEAADMTCRDRELNRQIFEFIRHNLTFDQLIDERDYSWIHVSLRSSANRGEVMRSPKAGLYNRIA